jgi:DinB superfamily
LLFQHIIVKIFMTSTLHQEIATWQAPTDMQELLRQATFVRETLLRELAAPLVQPPLGVWSALENAYHLHLVERGSASAVRKILEASERMEPVSLDTLRAGWERERKMLLNRTTKIDAPASVAPLETPPLEDVVRMLGESRAKLMKAVEGRSFEDLCSVSFPHPVLGVLSGALWVSFITLHEARHVEQIQELSTFRN